jgi:hypothetical protein
MERGVLVERPISPQLIVVGSILRQKHKQRSCLALGPTVAWLKASVQLGDGRLEPRTAGTPQGGVVSPLLANLFLKGSSRACWSSWSRCGGATLRPSCPSRALRETPRVHHAGRRHCGGVAVRGTRAATSNAGDRVPAQYVARRRDAPRDRVPPGPEGSRLRRGAECCGRIPLGGRSP